MKKVDINVLKESAHKLLFDMSEEEYETLLIEFDTITKQMELISEIEGVDEAEPMIFPYTIYGEEMREDVVKDVLTSKDALKNAGEVKNGMIKLPKVVK